MQEELISIDTVISSDHKPTYNVDWELTFFCNLDCSYCTAHDNLTRHPDKDRCKKSIDFILKHADLVMQVKQPWERSVTLNILGGETLIHPDIVEIFEYLQYCYKQYNFNWPLAVHVTTNGIVGKNVLSKCLPHINYLTVSYHTEANAKQKSMAIDNIYLLKKMNVNFTVRLMAHADPKNFDECMELAQRFDIDNIPYTIKPIGEPAVSLDWENDPTVHGYSEEQSNKFINYWNDKNKSKKISIVNMQQIKGKFIARSAGRTCCSEKKLCANGDRKNVISFIPKTEFKGWYCSVNWYFLFVRQYTENIYYSRSCRAKPDGTVGPLGKLDDSEKILQELKTDIQNNNAQIVVCPKEICGCGICAPKAQNKEDFTKIIGTHLDNKVLSF